MPIMITFAKCPGCGMQWQKREDLLNDAGIKMTAYEANLDILRLGKFLFTHICGAVISIQVDGFSDLYNGPIYTGRKTGTPECPGYCKKRELLKSCPSKCECAWVREIARIINNLKTA